MAKQQKVKELSNSSNKVKGKIEELKTVVGVLAKARPYTWGFAGALAGIHVELGAAMSPGYEGYAGFSGSAKEASKRHGEAVLALLEQLDNRTERFNAKRLAEWDKRLEDLLKPYEFLFKSRV